MASYNKSLSEWEFSVGDTAWFVAGYNSSELLLIKVEILKVKKTKYRILYEIDEPSDFLFDSTDLFHTKELGSKELSLRAIYHNSQFEHSDYARYELYNRTTSLYQHRYVITNQLYETWASKGIFKTGSNPRLKEFPIKVLGMEYFESDPLPKDYR